MIASPQDLSKRPFGDYRLPWWARSLVNFCQVVPANRIGKKVAFLVRKPVLRWNSDPMDVCMNGLRCRLYPHQNLSDKRLLTTPYLLDGEERAYLQKRLPRGAVVVDAGANIGAYSMLLMRNRPDLRVIAIEADPDLATRLSDNLKLNGLDDSCEIHRGAITSEPGTVRLFRCPENEGRNSLVPAADPSSTVTFVDVEGQTLLAVLDQKRIDRFDLLKMDIEGHEHPVLHAFFATAPVDRWPNYIQIEQYQRERINEAVSLCLEHGYRIVLRTRMNVLLEYA